MLVEKMLEYVTWEQVVIVLLVALWFVKVLQVITLRLRMRHRTAILESRLVVALNQNVAMKVKLHATLCPEDYDSFMSECVD